MCGFCPGAPESFAGWTRHRGDTVQGRAGGDGKAKRSVTLKYQSAGE